MRTGDCSQAHLRQGFDGLLPLTIRRLGFVVKDFEPVSLRKSRQMPHSWWTPRRRMVTRSTPVEPILIGKSEGIRQILALAASCDRTHGRVLGSDDPSIIKSTDRGSHQSCQDVHALISTPTTLPTVTDSWSKPYGNPVAPHSESRTARPDGSFVLSFRIDGLEEICNWLLAWSGRAEVLEPQQLRSMVAEKMNAGLKLNQ